MNHSEIVVILYDTIKPHCQDIKQNLYDLTKFKMGGQHQLNIVETRDITKTMRELTNGTYTWAVVVAVGNFLDQSAIFDTVQHAMDNNTPLVCHIVDRGGYYHFHSQWFAVNLAEYKALGMPKFDEREGAIEVESVDTIRSEANVHHDYTPTWIRPSSSIPKTYQSDYQYFGLQVVAKFIQAGHTIINIPDIVRNKKNFCYPDHNHDEIVQLIADKDYEPKDEGLWWFAKALRDIVNNLNFGYYVLNTEYLMPTNQSTKFNSFVGVCGGLKPACIAGQDNFADDSTVHLFDISCAAVDWQRCLLDKWNGDFAEFETIFRNFQAEHPNYRPVYFSHASIDENIDWFLDNAGISRGQFQQLWIKYQKMKHNFVELDLLQDNTIDKIINMANDSIGSYVWVSNAFNMDYLMFYKTRTWARTYRDYFITQLKNKITAPTVLEESGEQIKLANMQ